MVNIKSEQVFNQGLASLKAGDRANAFAFIAQAALLINRVAMLGPRAARSLYAAIAVTLIIFMIFRSLRLSDSKAKLSLICL
jgi:hypothetical protein